MIAAELLPIFRDQFPEFDGETDEKILRILNNAILIHALCEMATVHLAAHLLTINNDSGVGGSGGSVDGGGAAREVVSETAKSISTSFNSMTAAGSGDSFYASTPYGRTYLELRKNCSPRRFSVRVA